jgi:streptogramin lyase
LLKHYRLSSLRSSVYSCAFQILLGLVLVSWGLEVHAQLPAANFNYLRRDVDLFSSSFSSLTEDNQGFIWFGSKSGGGLYRYDGYTVKSFIFNPERMKESISTSLINSIYKVNDTLIYVGTYFGYSTLNPYTGVIRTYNNSLDSVDHPSVTYTACFLQDSVNRTLWIYTGFGLASIDHATGRFKVKPTPQQPNEIIPTAISRMVKDASDQDRIYLAGPQGFYHYTVSLNHYQAIPCPLRNNMQLHIHDMVQDPNGNVWLATNSGSVMQYNPANKQWKEFPIAKAATFPENHADVIDILYVDPSRLWLATTSKVGILHTDTGAFEGWEHQASNPNGLLQHAWYISMLADRHGRLWVGSRYGVQFAREAFLPAPATRRQVPVAITNLIIKPILDETKQPLIYTDTLSLAEAQRDITFQYVLPNPLDRNNVTYQYLLDGFDKEWITTDQRTARYGKLRGGEYTFRIKAQEGRSATWSPETSLTIRIPKRLTEHLWFWIVLGIVGIGSGILYFKFMVARARKQEKMKADFEHQLSEIQMQALRAQMNPHFLFNSLNSIKYFAISKSKDETAAYLSKFALLVRNILTNSKSRTISLKDEVDALRLYIEIEHLRLEGKFDYTIDIDSSIPIRQVQIPPMILQPFVENAIWHGLMHKDGKGMLRVHIQDMGRQIQCVIEDNGIGRVRSAELRKSQMEHRKSEGMQITADRIALINKIYQIHTEVDVIDLKHEDGTAAGTRVVIHVPLINDEEE